MRVALARAVTGLRARIAASLGDDTGASPVEFVLIGTLLTVLTLAVLQFGLAVYVRNVVHGEQFEGGLQQRGAGLLTGTHGNVVTNIRLIKPSRRPLWTTFGGIRRSLRGCFGDLADRPRRHARGGAGCVRGSAPSAPTRLAIRSSPPSSHAPKCAATTTTRWPVALRPSTTRAPTAILDQADAWSEFMAASVIGEPTLAQRSALQQSDPEGYAAIASASADGVETSERVRSLDNMVQIGALQI